MINKATSACLCGVECRYDGTSNDNLSKEATILICPEVLGGLSTPRNPVEIVGKVITNTYDDLVAGLISIKDKDGNDYSQEFIEGARKTLKIIQDNNIKQVNLKSKSPSCGSGMIYDGTFSKTLIKGDGVTASLLKKHNITIL